MTAVPALKGIHHLKLPVADLARSLDFYERVLGAKRIPEADHRRAVDGSLYAYILVVPGLGTMLELRLHPTRAVAQAGFDPIILSVADRAALTAWVVHLDTEKVRHSEIVTAIRAWLVVFEDPDGHRLRLYTDETHGPELKPDEDHEWIKD